MAAARAQHKSRRARSAANAESPAPGLRSPADAGSIGPGLLCVIAGTALAVRLVHIWQMRESPFFDLLMGDSKAYDEWAQRIAAGAWIGTDVFYQAPLYPY